MPIQLDPFMRVRYRNTVSTTESKVMATCPTGQAGGQVTGITTNITYSEGPSTSTTVATNLNYCSTRVGEFWPSYFNADRADLVRVMVAMSSGFIQIPSNSNETAFLDFYINNQFKFTSIWYNRAFEFAFNTIKISRHIFPGDLMSQAGGPYVPGYTYSASDVYRITLRIPAHNFTRTSSQWPNQANPGLGQSR